MHGVIAEAEFRLIVANADPIKVSAQLRFDPNHPFAVCITFKTGAYEHVSWTFARELLDDGASCTVGEGDVRIWPQREMLRVELSSPSGRALLETARQPIADFITRTNALVPVGTEATRIDLDHELATLLR